MESDQGIEVFFEKRGQQKKESLILKYEIESPLSTCIEVEKSFMQNLSAFWLSFVDKKRIVDKSLFGLHLHPLIIGFFSFV